MVALGLSLLPFLLPLAKQKVEVCLSPGCLADGAQTTLSKIQALAPPSIECVGNGKCQSLCGKGPILIHTNNNDRRVVKKYMKDEKILPFLQSCIMDDDDDWILPDGLLEGYDLVAEGLELLSKKKYTEASQNLKEGIEKALEPTKDYGNNNMEWMVQAHQSLADALLQQSSGAKNNINDDALHYIQVAIKLNPQNPALYETLVRIYQANKNEEGEYQALQTLLVDLPEPENPDRTVANRRRELGFRLKSLQNKLG